MTTRTRVWAAAALACLVAGSASAQRYRLPEGPWVPPRFPTPGFHDGGFTRHGMGWATDVGTLEFTDAEVRGLRAYLLKGGFLWVDDFWGTRAWAQWTAQMQRVLGGVNK